MAVAPGKLAVHRQETAIVLLVLPLLIGGFYVQPEIILFSEHPQSLHVLANSSFSLSCSVILALDVVEQLPSPQIVWDLDGEVAPGISTTNNLGSVLEVTSAKSSHTGWYRCLAIDGNDTSLCQGSLPCLPTVTASQAAYVKVIDDSPTSKIVNVSSVCTTMVISCLGPNNVSMELTFPVTWLREGTVVNTSSTQLLPSGDLVLKPSEEMPGTYQCYTMSPSSEGSIMLNEVTVHLNENENGAETIPAVEVQASSKVVPVDTVFELVCTVEGWCDPHTVTWSKDGQALDLGPMSGVGAESVAMVMSSTEQHHGGRYCCSIGNKTSCVDVVVIVPMTNGTTHLVNIVNQQDNMLVTLDCTPWPDTNISPLWLHNGRVVSTGIQKLVVNITGIPSDTTMGIFQCFPANISLPAVALHRVLPLGWPNPPGNLSYVLKKPDGPLAHIVLSWQPPTYTGGLHKESLDYYRFAEEEHVDEIYEAFIGNVTMESLLLYDSIFHFSIAIVNSGDQVQVISESSQPLTVSGDFCTLYSSQPPNVTLNCEVDGQSVILWKGLDTDLTYNYSNSGTSIEIGCYSGGDVNNVTQFNSSYNKTGSIPLNSLAEGDICSFVGVDTRCETISTTGSCTASSQSYFLTSSATQSTTHSIALTTIHSTTSTASSAVTSVTFVTSTIRSTVSSALEQDSPTSSITTLTPSSVTMLTPSIMTTLSPFILTTLTPSSAMESTLVPSTSSVKASQLPDLSMVVVVVSVVAGGLLLAFIIFALLLIGNHRHQRSKSKKDDDQWLEDAVCYPPLSVLDGSGEDAASCHTVYAQICNEELLEKNLLFDLYPVDGHASPATVDPRIGAVTILRNEEEVKNGTNLTLELDPARDAAYSASSSRKTSRDTSASSLGTDSGYIHCSTCTYTSFGNSETHLDQRLEAIQEDLELCRSPCTTEEDAYPGENKLERSTSFQDIHCSTKDVTIIESDSNSENSTNLNAPPSNAVVPPMPS